MYLVVDANILIAALIRDSTTRKLLLSEKFELVAPEFLAGEIDKHIAEISKKAKVEKAELRSLILQLLKTSKIRAYKPESFAGKMKDAIAISPDKYDSPYFALALHLRCPIWSNDKKLKNQSEVTILSTKEVMQMGTK